MDPTAITQLGIALAATAAAIIGFNRLVGKGPRGTLWIVAACVFTWGVILPIVLRDPDEASLPAQLELLISVLRLCGIIGFAIGILDLLQQRIAEDEHPLAEWLLRQPLLWGIVVSANFYALLFQETIDSPLLWRYMAGHPVEVIEGAFFFVGMAFLVLRLFDVLAQQKLTKTATLGPVPAGGQSIAACDGLLTSLADLPLRLKETYFVRRLTEALQFVRRKGSADGLDSHLRHLEELDAIQMHAAYATLRIIIWAIPILGFLGTVIGITVAIANLSPEALEQSMSDVTQGLGVAFDTTAEALALTMVLMFTKALVEKYENRLLAEVDARVSLEMLGRFQDAAERQDPNVVVVRRMAEQVIEAVETLAARQADVWKSSIDETHQRWAATTTDTARIVRDSLSTSLKESLDLHAKTLNEGTAKYAERLAGSAAEHSQTLERGGHESVTRLREGLEKLAELLVEALHRHGEVLTASEKELAAENRQHLSEVEAALGQAMATAADRQEQLVRQSEHLLKEMQIALVEAAGASVKQQEQLLRQGEVLLKVVDATGQIKKLESALNSNLAAVSRTNSFEEMILSLSAAIQLLSARLGRHAVINLESHTADDDAGSKAA